MLLYVSAPDVQIAVRNTLTEAGYQVVDALSQWVPVVGLTTYSFAEDEVRSWGCFEMLRRPLDPEELLAAVRRNLEG